MWEGWRREASPYPDQPPLSQPAGYYSAPGKPSQNGFVESECLNERSLHPARRSPRRHRSLSPRRYYNEVPPHSAHRGLTPNAARLNPAAGRLRNPGHLRRSAATIGAHDAIATQGLSNDQKKGQV